MKKTIISLIIIGMLLMFPIVTAQNNQTYQEQLNSIVSSITITFNFMDLVLFTGFLITELITDERNIYDLNQTINYYEENWMPKEDCHCSGSGGSPTPQTPINEEIENETEDKSPDLNDDGQVDERDQKILSDNYGCTGDCIADLNNDGQVDTTDLTRLATYWTGDLRLKNLRDNYGRDDCSADNDWCNGADYTQDHIVDTTDLARLASKYPN